MSGNRVAAHIGRIEYGASTELGSAPFGQQVSAVERRPLLNAAFDLTSPEKRAAVCEAVIDLMAALFNADGRELRSMHRCSQETARIRQIAMYLCSVTLGLNQTAIGRAFCRDRTTVRHAIQLIEMLRDDMHFDRIMDQAEDVVAAAFFCGGNQREQR
jgi:chromosomal replication initiation ATPase DnaA